jgi:pimeloyl-ACP methyl ester carboxylesterase
VGLDYLIAQEKAAQLSTSVLYDRAGSGWSDPVKLPRTSTQVTDELRELLRVAGVPAPYLLVGHSLGGLYARHYAVRFPDEAALLLLDPAHEDYDAYMPKELTEMREGWSKKQLGRLMNLAIAGAFRFALGRRLLLRVPAIKHYRKLYRALFAQEMADWPEGIREAWRIERDFFTNMPARVGTTCHTCSAGRRLARSLANAPGADWWASVARRS